jgi:hypothetical protein
MIIILFFCLSLGCSGIGGSCEVKSDCCADLCSPTSCSQGICIGSTCLVDGSFCEMDCQCCSGECIVNDLNAGVCGVPSAKIEKKNGTKLDVGSCCSAGDCDISGTSCNICCPVGEASNCNSNTCNCWCTSGNIITAVSVSPNSITPYNVFVVTALSLLVVLFLFSITLITLMIRNKRLQYVAA